MKILIITPYAEPEKGACVVRVNGFRDYFQSQGHEADVYAPQRQTAPLVEGVTRYSGIAKLQSLIIKTRFDAIIGTSPPLTHNFFALLASRIAGSKFLLDAKDPFTDVMRKMEPKKVGSLKFKAFEFMEYFTHKFSDRVIFLNKPYLENAASKFSLDRKKLFLAPNGSDTQKVRFDESERKRMRKELGLGQDFTFIYVGGIGDKDLVGFVRESFAQLSKEQNARSVFILSFEGTAVQQKILDSMKSALADRGIADRAHFIFNVEFAQLYKYFSAADAGLVAYPDFEMQVLGAKVFDYIAAGLPIAAKASWENSELRGFIESNNIGFMASDWKDFNHRFSQEFVRKPFNREKIIEVAKQNSRQNSCKIVLEEIKKAVGK